MKTLLLILTAALSLPAQNAFGADAFSVKVSGHGKPMILIPGLSSSGETYDTTVAHYQDRFECHVLTLAGFAGVPSIKTPPDAMLPTVREAIATYIRDQKLVKPVIVGHSLGGFVALDLGSKYPDLVGPLVILDSYPFLSAIYDPTITAEKAKSYSADTAKYMIGQSQDMYERGVKAGVATRMMVTKDSDFERIIEWGLKTDRFAAGEAMAEMMSTDLRDSIASIKSRTLVLGTWIGYKEYTDRDKTMANLKTQYTKLRGVEIDLNDTARHFIMWDDPNWMFAHMDEFLKADARVSGR